MLHVSDLPSEEARYAIAHGEFSQAITKGLAAVIMSQDWCPEWLAMQRWLEDWRMKGRPAEKDIDVYVYLYNREREFYEFLEMKEHQWGNVFIPYVRYYCEGRLIAESNYVTPEGFVKRFDIHICQAKESL
ncbi:MAG: hypothetical protein N2314_07265 [Brevinematales bacterium]|nr:hypothetical protein [Brevinematales bacterium]